jgi:hypothetical protein
MSINANGTNGTALSGSFEEGTNPPPKRISREGSKPTAEEKTIAHQEVSENPLVLTMTFPLSKYFRIDSQG